MNLVNFFPGPFEIGPTRRDHPHLGVVIAVAFLGFEMVGNGIVENRGFPDALGASKDGFHGALVLVHRVNPRQKVTDQKPRDEPDDDSEGDAHSFFRSWRDSTFPPPQRQYQTTWFFAENAALPGASKWALVEP